MSLEPRVLAKVDNRLRSELQKTTTPQMAKIPISDAQWAVWKRYCEMVGVSIGGGLAVLIDHELASVVDQDLESLNDLFTARELVLAERDSALAQSEAAFVEKEKLLRTQEDQIKTREQVLERKQTALESRQRAFQAIQARTSSPYRSQPRLTRNEPCWCGSGKKFKVCHGRPEERGI